MKEIVNKKEIALSNSLVAGKYHLTREEQNLIFLVASQINKDDEDFKSYKIKLSDLERATGVKHNRVRLKELMHSIMSKPIWLNKEQTKIANWFAFIEADNKQSALYCEFHKSLKPHLLQLKNCFTKAELETIFTFNSKYSTRLFLLLSADYGIQSNYKTKVETKYMIDDLINRFETPKSYSQRYSMFKERVINPAIEEINNLTDFHITYIDNTPDCKAGRRIEAIKFTIEKREPTIEQIAQKLLNTKTKIDYIPKDVSLRTREILLDDELNLYDWYIEKIFNIYDKEDIEQVCLDLYNNWDNKKIKSRRAVFIKNIKELTPKPTTTIQQMNDYSEMLLKGFLEIDKENTEAREEEFNRLLQIVKPFSEEYKEKLRNTFVDQLDNMEQQHDKRNLERFEDLAGEFYEEHKEDQEASQLEQEKNHIEQHGTKEQYQEFLEFLEWKETIKK